MRMRIVTYVIVIPYRGGLTGDGVLVESGSFGRPVGRLVAVGHLYCRCRGRKSVSRVSTGAEHGRGLLLKSGGDGDPWDTHAARNVPMVSATGEGRRCGCACPWY